MESALVPRKRATSYARKVRAVRVREGGAGRSGIAFDGLALMALPWLVLSANSAWIFTRSGTIDPWVYHGFFRNLHQHLAVLFPGTYYGSRLAWILPGFAAYSVFPAPIANYVLHLSYFYLALFSLYVALKHTAGRDAALLASILFGSYSYFLRAIGWDYVDGSGIAYYLLTWAAVVKALTGRHRRLWLVLAGTACGAMFYTYTVWGALAPSFLCFFLLEARRAGGGDTRSNLKAFCAYFGAGLIAVTIALAVVNWSVTGDVWFYLPSLGFSVLHAARYLVAGQQNPWKKQGWDWLAGAAWLVVPAVASLGALHTISATRSPLSADKRRLIAWFFAANLLFAVSIELGLEARGLPELEWPNKVSRLVPAAYLFIGAQIGLLLTEGGLRRSWLWALGTAGAFVLLLPEWVPNLFKIETAGLAVCLGLALGSAGMLLSQLPANRAVGVGVLLGGLWLASLGVGRQWGPDVATKRASFERITRAFAAVREASSKWGRPVFWYDESEPRFAPEFISTSATYLWGFSLLNARFPSLDDSPPHRRRPGQFIVILSARGDAFALGRESFRAGGLELRALDTRAVCAEDGCFTLTFVEVAAA